MAKITPNPISFTMVVTKDELEIIFRLLRESQIEVDGATSEMMQSMYESINSALHV